MSLYQLLGAVELGLIFSLIVLGVYLSFRVLHFPDLTVDGSFPLGGAIAAIMVTHGLHPWLGVFAAGMAGFMAGMITAWLNVRWKILHLLAGILTMTALYSINLRIMGQPNISLYNVSTVFTFLEHWPSIKSMITPIFMLLIASFALFLLYKFLTSEIGLAMRATGANPRMAKAQGINDARYIILGIGLSNAIVAMGGALLAQYQGFADVNSGYGKVVEGLAAVIVGEAIFHARKIHWALFACIIGAIFYRIAVALALEADFIGLKASDLNLVTAIIVACAMILPQWRKTILEAFKTRRGS
jgi:putative ABC transport system permease protein